MLFLLVEWNLILAKLSFVEVVPIDGIGQRIGLRSEGCIPGGHVPMGAAQQLGAGWE